MVKKIFTFIRYQMSYIQYVSLKNNKNNGEN